MATPLEIAQFPCLPDNNYGFLIHSPETRETAAVDTPEALKIMGECQARDWTLTHIWNTHHHPDHVGGNRALAKEYELEIIGPGHDTARIPGLTKGVRDRDRFTFGGYEVHVLETPGHTSSHIIFHIPDMDMAFVGDTLFVMGCGRLFEGTPEQMFDSLAKIAALPASTRLYCAHEYTLSNAAFAITVEPDNDDLKAAITAAQALRDQGRPTVPTTVEAELKTNPFVRTSSPEELGRRRALKDGFRG